MLSSLGNFFGGVENKKVSSSNSNGSDLSYDSFMEESGFSTDVISSPADEVKMFRVDSRGRMAPRSICSVFYLTLLLFLFLFIVLSGAKFMAPPSSWLVLLV